MNEVKLINDREEYAKSLKSAVSGIEDLIAMADELKEYENMSLLLQARNLVDCITVYNKLPETSLIGN